MTRRKLIAVIDWIIPKNSDEGILYFESRLNEDGSRMGMSCNFFEITDFIHHKVPIDYKETDTVDFVKQHDAFLKELGGQYMRETPNGQITLNVKELKELYYARKNSYNYYA